MQELIAKLRESQITRYIFIGGVSYVIDISTLLSLSKIFLFSPTASVAISFWAGIVISFLLQKYIAFGDRKNDKKAFGKQVVIYGLLVAFNYMFTLLFVALFSSILGLIIARTIALIATTSWNYLIYKKIFIRSKEA